MPVLIRVRAPTAAAWLFLAVAVIAFGELFYALRGKDRLTLLQQELTRVELLPMLAALALAAVLGLVWLASLYLRPGVLVLDKGKGVMRRERRSVIRRRVVEAPAGAWRARVVYFSERDRADRRFKRLELDGPGLSEVLLFTDVRDGPGLIRLLEEGRERLGAFEEHVERPG